VQKDCIKEEEEESDIFTLPPPSTSKVRLATALQTYINHQQDLNHLQV